MGIFLDTGFYCGIIEAYLKDFYLKSPADFKIQTLI